MMGEQSEHMAAGFRSVVGEAYVRVSEPMSGHTSMRVGGPADYFVEPGSAEELIQVIKICRSENLPYFVMGNGSNLLVSDDGFRGAIIRIGKRMGKIEVTGESIYAEAGALLKQVASAALENSLCGFEFAAGIPGSLGGACVMNAGAYGGEMKQVLRSVRCLDEDDNLLTLRGDELELGYRTSVFMKRPMTVVGALIELRKGDRSEISAKMDDLRMQRQSKQPLDLPSAGSTFKRPEGYFAGKLIMDAGLRGYSVGGAQVSEKHCGFIVNRGGATASDVAELISYVRDTVERQFGVRLETEVRFIGRFSNTSGGTT